MEHNKKPRKLMHTSLIPMRWADMDAYRHVNNAVYFTYMEQARVEFLENMGYTVAPKGSGPVIVNASSTFLVPMIYPGVVEVRMYLGAPGRSSIPSTYEIRLQGDGTLYATGEAKIVWIEMATGKSVPVPDDLRALINDI